jgi:hypothetical protein
VLDANEEGLDGGDVAGFGAEMVLDPINLLGGALVRPLAKAALARGPRYAGGLEKLNSVGATKAEALRLSPDCLASWLRFPLGANELAKAWRRLPCARLMVMSSASSQTPSFDAVRPSSET